MSSTRFASAVLTVSALSLLLAGCAAVPEASTTAATDCKVAPLQTATLTHSKNRQPASRLDQVKAEADFNRFVANSQHGRTGQQLLLEDIQRDCNR